MKTRQLFLLVLSLVFSLSLVTTARAQLGNLVFPVRALGNCKDLSACQAYCLKNMGTCLPFLEGNNLITKEEADQLREVYGVTSKPTTITPGTDQSASLSATLSLATSGTVSGKQVIYVDSAVATGVEIFATNDASLAPLYIGQASKGTAGNFTYAWETSGLANGTYQIYARASNGAQTFDSNKVSVTVSNTAGAVQDTAPRTTASQISTLSRDLKSVDGATTEAERALEKEASTAASDYVEGLKKEAAKKTDGQETVTWLEAKQKEILMAAEATARAASNPLATSTLEKSLLSDLTKVRLEAEGLLGTKIATSTLDTALVKKISTAVHESVTAETLARERVGSAITKDSDSDDVSDYDELYVFLTNPLKPDSDADGTSDADEIKNGSNPTISGATPVTYEDVLTQGTVVSEDVLAVTVVEAGEVQTAGTKKSLKNVVFRGKGLPNSFVTLYIFSDPIVVTTKTNENGEWEYVFNRELPDGRHEVYVAVVGNAGKIVAKSNPLPFVKQAEAVSFGPNATYDERPGFFTPGSIILTLSLVGLAVVGILILVGVSRRSRRAQMTVNATRPASQNLPPITPTAPQPMPQPKQPTPPPVPPPTNNQTTL